MFMTSTIINLNNGNYQSGGNLFNSYFFLPNNIFKIALPTLRSIPALEVGIPVLRANFCFACVMPNALLREKESPSIPVFDFFAIL